MPRLAWNAWPSPAVWLIVWLPVLLYLPALSGRLDADPLVFVGLIGDGARLSGGWPWIDPNVGYHAQALGKLAADLWLQGRVPWWNPYNGVGLPLAAEAQPAALFLPFVLLYHYRMGWLWVELVLQIIAGLCTYALLRRLRLGEWAALTGALLFEFNGAFAWHAAPSITPVAFLPMLMLGVEQLFARVQQGRPGGWWLIPLALAWSICAGFPETAYLDGMFVALWVVFRLPDLERPRRLRFLGILGIAGAAGLALSLPQVVPFVEFVGLGFVGGHVGYFAHTVLPREGFALTLMPGLFGPIFRFSDPARVIGAVWGDIGGYLTVLQLAVALLAIPLAPRRWAWAPVLWLVFCFAKTFDVRPLSDLFNLLPLVTATAVHRYAPASWEFAAVLLISMGLDAMQRGRRPSLRAVLLAFALAAAGALAALWLARGPVVYLLQAADSRRAVVLAVGWAALSLLGGALLVLLARSRRVGVGVLASVLVIEAVVAFAAPIRSGARHVDPAQPGVDFLRAHVGLGRVYTLGPMAPNYGAYFKVAQINQNYLPVPSDWMNYVKERLDLAANPMNFAGGTNHVGGLDGAVGQLQAHLAAYEEAGVRYVLAPPGTDPFAQVEVLRGDPSLHHEPLQLQESASASLHWQVPGQAQSRTLQEVAVLIGNYAGRSNGQLEVRVCLDDGACATGQRALAGSADNQYLSIRLVPGLPMPPSADGARLPLTVRFTDRQSREPVVLWLDGIPAAEAGTVRLDAAPSGVSPSMRLSFVDVGPAATRQRKVYEGEDMSIYQLGQGRPYFDAIDGRCTVAPLTREQVRVQCATPARLLRREAFYPGWSAQVDGQPVALQRAHVVFQSVELAPGVHDIRFHYQPTHGRWILAGFAAGLLVWLVGLAGELAAVMGGRHVART